MENNIIIEKKAYAFLDNLTPYCKDYFGLMSLISWVRFYYLFLTDPNKSKPVKTRIRSLNMDAVKCFVIFIQLIWWDIDGSDLGLWETFFERFHSKKVTEFSQFNVALNLCLNLKNPTWNFNPNLDCWLSDIVDSHGYPNVHFKEMEVSWINTQGYRIKNIKGGLNIQLKAHRWVCSLKNNILSSKDQAAHRCGNKNCFSPFHMKVASDVENKNDIMCRYGCAHYCPHYPKCIWTINGQWLPCRNDPNKATSIFDCLHNPNCFQ
jgi:hypothetical protein